ncbi:hypothetical protein PV703_07715 [Streptomyces sp. ME01-24h]|nr:hypothetical protein [Streptomyces sp. ME19-03-3]MDX3353208.1 hypothetical protein [Streptomyces sp. ME01-24h]
MSRLDDDQRQAVLLGMSRQLSPSVSDDCAHGRVERDSQVHTVHSDVRYRRRYGQQTVCVNE